jgi:transposase
VALVAAEAVEMPSVVCCEKERLAMCSMGWLVGYEGDQWRKDVHQMQPALTVWGV